MFRYIEVAVGRLSSLFHYHLPAGETRDAPLKPGCRLLVPFGSRVAIAYFVRYIERPDVSETKDILAVLDNVSPLPAPLITLLRWISDYYVAPFGAVIAAALPKEEYKIARRYKVTDRGRAASDAGTIKSETEKTILAILTKGVTDASSLQRKIGAEPLRRTLSSLKRKGWIKIDFALHLPTRREKKTAFKREAPRSEPHPLNTDQKKVCDEIAGSIDKGLFTPFLLHGVTGSGKTEVYLNVIEKALSKKKGAIVLVPEIGLTAQLAARFENRFGKTVVVLHSGLSHGERRETWRNIREGGARIAIGARSALFAPMDKIGVIIVDEEHDPSYKQEEGVRYHARDAAVVYGKSLNAVVVLGSATPSFESFYNGMSGKYKIVSLPQRVSARALPSIKIVDLRKRDLWVLPFLTRPLLSAIEKRLADSEQVILFVNRRGYTPSLLCGDCGFKWRCENCSVSLAFHKKRKKMLCHYCGFWSEPPLVCPECKGIRLLYLGVGTEQVEEEIRSVFPSARVLRMDRDTTSRRMSHHRIVTAMEQKSADILIGTQMVAKGHDFPDVTLVGVICADLTLNLPDFRASERTFQLLAQVSGRAGRGDVPGEVLIQTFQPEQPLFRVLPGGTPPKDCSAFYNLETAGRKEAGYPPFCRLILLLLSHKEEDAVVDQAEHLASVMKREGRGVSILGPAPAMLSRLRKEHRYQILLKGTDRVRLRAVLKKGLDYIQSADPKGVRLAVDVDPQNVT